MTPPARFSTSSIEMASEQDRSRAILHAVQNANSVTQSITLYRFNFNFIKRIDNASQRCKHLELLFLPPQVIVNPLPGISILFACEAVMPDWGR